MEYLTERQKNQGSCIKCDVKNARIMKIRNVFIKAWAHRRDLRNLISSIYFNFHYLPFKDAVKLPILLYKPKLLSMKGKVKIEGSVRYGMIRMGFPTVSLYPNSGITYENLGGTIVFKGMCLIGNNSAMSIGPKGNVCFGQDFVSTTTLRLTSYDSIKFGDRCLLGWDCILLDTDFHKLTKLSGGYSNGHFPISIGADNWFGNGCRIMKRTVTPNHCVISAGTTLAGIVDVPEYSVISGVQEIKAKAYGVWWNIQDDSIEY